jgi:hypothetical protein
MLIRVSAGTLQVKPGQCSDGMRNGDESCIVGGGSCPTKCADGQTCRVNTDW